MSKQRFVFLVGAGASVAPPSSLPMFAAIRAHLIEQLDLDSNTRQVAEQLAPEAFMLAFHQGLAPAEDWISDVLGRGSPNAVHYALACGLKDEGVAWVLNVDELIEKAASELAISCHPSSYPEEEPASSANIIKPHGTLSVGKYLFRSDQVLRPLSRPWSERFLRDADRSHLVAIGYAAFDLDLRPILERAIQVARDVTWFESADKVDHLLERLPALRESHVTLISPDEASQLTPSFLKWSRQRGLMDSTPRAALEVAEQGPDSYLPSMHADLDLVHALIAERCGDRRTAKSLYLRVLLRGVGVGPRSRFAMSRLTSIGLYEPALWARLAMRCVNSPLRRAVPSRVRKKLDRVHITLLSSHYGRHEDAIRRCERVDDAQDCAVLTARAKSARYLGNYEEALDLAREAYGAAHSQQLVDEAAHALFEVEFTSRWSGDFEGAHAALREFSQGLDQMAGARWLAWSAWQEASLFIYANQPEAAMTALGRARSLFEADGLTAGVVTSLTVMLTAARMMGDDEAFEFHCQELLDMRGGRGWTDFTQGSIDQERAEHARATGDYELSGRLLIGIVAASPHRPILRALGLLGQVELARQQGMQNSSHLAAAREAVIGSNSRYLRGHLVITEYLVGERDASAALEVIEELGVSLATRNQGPATHPLDYCLGPKPETHQLYFP